jgi:cyclopropane fatty-acyl-phospholipid synthase-like methyltransferase
LAIIVFARSKGVTISQEDLDQVRKAIDPDGPNLGELLVPGYRQLRKQVGKAQAVGLLEQLVA